LTWERMASVERGNEARVYEIKEEVESMGCGPLN
jgi:hypothetical protein